MAPDWCPGLFLQPCGCGVGAFQGRRWGEQLWVPQPGMVWQGLAAAMLAWGAPGWPGAASQLRVLLGRLFYLGGTS